MNHTHLKQLLFSDQRIILESEKMIKKILDQRGQSLLEALIALAALLIILSATANAIVTSLSNSVFVKNENLANKLAQEGMEYMRNLKSNNYVTFKDLDPSIGSPNKFCLKDLPPAWTPYVPGSCVLINNMFERTVTVENLDPDSTSPAAECNFVEVNPTDSDGVTVHSVVIQVEWESGRCTTSGTRCHKTVAKSCFVNNN